MLWLFIVFVVLASAVYVFGAPPIVQKCVYFGVALTFFLFVLSLFGLLPTGVGPVIEHEPRPVVVR